MIKVFANWQRRRKYRALHRQLCGLDGSVLADVGLKIDDLEVLRRGRSPWEGR